MQIIFEIMFQVIFESISEYLFDKYKKIGLHLLCVSLVVIFVPLWLYVTNLTWWEILLLSGVISMFITLCSLLLGHIFLKLLQRKKL